MNDQKEIDIKSMASYFQEKNDIPVFDYVIKENNKFLKESRNILQKMTGNLTQD